MLLPVLPPIKQVLFEALRCRRGAEGERGRVHLELLCSIFHPFHLQAADTEPEMESL